MTRSETSPPDVGPAGAPPGAAIWPWPSDLGLQNLTSEQRRLLEERAGDWLNSLSFASRYSHPPAERVWVKASERDVQGRAYYYTERTWGGIFRCVQVYGVVSGPLEDLAELLRHRSAHLLRCVRRSPDVERDRAAGLPGIIAPYAEDVVIELPADIREYLATLGSTTRKHLPYYRRRLLREWGADYGFVAARGLEIREPDCRALLELSATRVRAKGSRHMWSARIAEARLELARDCGLFCGIFFRGQLAGGTLSYLSGDDAFLVLIGHDPRYDRLNVGNVSLFLTVERLILEGTRRFHLLWGNSFYKHQFGGAREELLSVSLTRGAASRAALVLPAGMARLKRIAAPGYHRVWRRFR